MVCQERIEELEFAIKLVKSKRDNDQWELCRFKVVGEALEEFLNMFYKTQALKKVLNDKWIKIMSNL
jgi:hypothetical protein